MNLICGGKMEVKIRNLIKDAMKDKNEAAKITYRSILDNAQKIAKRDGNRAVNDNDFIQATKNEIKALEELAAFAQSGTDRAVEMQTKIDYCRAILPQMASEDEMVSFLVNDNIDKNIGSCMKALKQKFAASFDGKIAQAASRRYIN